MNRRVVARKPVRKHEPEEDDEHRVGDAADGGHDTASQIRRQIGRELGRIVLHRREHIAHAADHVARGERPDAFDETLDLHGDRRVVARHLVEHVDDLLDEHGQKHRREQHDGRDHDDEADERTDAAGNTAMLQPVDDRRLDEGDERSDRQKLDDRSEDADHVEQHGTDDQRADNGPDAQRQDARIAQGAIVADFSMRGLVHRLPITPSGSILSWIFLSVRRSRRDT